MTLALSSAVGCGGTVDLKSEDKLAASNGGGAGLMQNEPLAGRDGSGEAGSNESAAGSGGSEPMSVGGSGGSGPLEAGGASDITDGPPLSGSHGDPQVVGWQWNVACGYSVEGYCARDGAVCVNDWTHAKTVGSWCASTNVSNVALLPSCHGYNVVEVHGIDATGDAADLFNTYYYDLTSSQLVHVDTDRIPSCTQCNGGESGSKFDVAGCDYASVDCH